MGIWVRLNESGMKIRDLLSGGEASSKEVSSNKAL
jgi:hypothetical protein